MGSQKPSRSGRYHLTPKLLRRYKKNLGSLTFCVVFGVHGSSRLGGIGVTAYTNGRLAGGAHYVVHTRYLERTAQMFSEPSQRLRPGIGGGFFIITGTRVVEECVFGPFVDLVAIL